MQSTYNETEVGWMDASKDLLHSKTPEKNGIPLSWNASSRSAFSAVAALDVFILIKDACGNELEAELVEVR